MSDSDDRVPQKAERKREDLPGKIRVTRGDYCESVISLPENGTPGTAKMVCGTSVVPLSVLVDYVQHAKAKDGVAPSKVDLRIQTGNDQWQDVTIDPKKLLAIDEALKKAGITDGWDLAIGDKGKDLKIMTEQQRVVMPHSMLDIPLDRLQDSLGTAYRHMKKNKPPERTSWDKLT